MTYKTDSSRLSRPRIAGLAGALLAAMILMSPARSEPQSGMYRTDAGRTGRTPYECTTSPQLKWSFSTSAACSSSPVVADNGTVYFGSYDKRLYAVSSNGAGAWSYLSNGVISATAAISSNGTIYFPTTSGSLYSLGGDGSLNWSVTLGPVGYSITCAPLVAPNGNIYCGSDSKYVYCVKPDGTVAWSYNAGAAVRYGLSMSPDGSVLYAPSADGRIYAINASSGTLKWKSPVVSPGNVCAVGGDGAVYVTGTDGNLSVLNSNGTLRWTRSAAARISAAPTIGFDGTIYFGSQDRTMYAWNPNGSLKWTHVFSLAIYSSATVDAYGTLLVGAYDGDLTALSTADGSVLWERQLGEKISCSPAVGRGGNLFVIDASGRLTKFSGPLRFPDTPEPSSLLALAWGLGAGAGLMRWSSKRRTRTS